MCFRLNFRALLLNYYYIRLYNHICLCRTSGVDLIGNPFVRDVFSVFFSTIGCFFRAFFAAFSVALAWAFASLSTWRCRAFSWASSSFFYLFSTATTFLKAVSAFFPSISACFLAVYSFAASTYSGLKIWVPVSSLLVRFSFFLYYLLCFSVYRVSNKPLCIYWSTSCYVANRCCDRKIRSIFYSMACGEFWQQPEIILASRQDLGTYTHKN